MFQENIQIIALVLINVLGRKIDISLRSWVINSRPRFGCKTLRIFQKQKYITHRLLKELFNKSLPKLTKFQLGEYEKRTEFRKPDDWCWGKSV